MKKITWIFFSLFAFLSVNAQIGIIEGLNATALPTGWTTVGFGGTTTSPCEGSHAWRRNFYVFATTGSLTSPNYVGASNGTDLTVSFQWKSTEWEAGSGVDVAVNAQYSTDNGATWISIGSPITTNTITECTTFSHVIPAASLPEGSDFRFRVNGAWVAGDGYFWVDNINITQVTALAPNCDAALVSPANGSLDANLLGILSWSPATGLPSGYVLSVGTTTGGTDVVNALNVGLATSYNIPGILNGDTTYYVNITPSNANGAATGCTEYSFTTGPTPIEGVLCENAIVIDALPFTTEDTTANYADVYYEGAPGTGCSTSGYLNGNDVVYSYTAGFTGTVKIVLTPATGNTWGGLFVYANCTDIGVNCLGGAFGSSAAPKMIEEFPVVSGQTYYMVISTFASPQTIAYTLDITENTCTNGAATYTVVSDCQNGEQFLVNVNLTSLGSAESMTISDDQGSAPLVANATGTFVFGPYPNATPVIFTVNNDQDEACFLTSAAVSQAVCPPNCEEAEIISTCDESVTAEFAAGAGAWNVSACGWTTPGTEKIYSFTPEETGEYELTVESATGGYVDYFYKAASGTCDNTGWTCIDDLNSATTVSIGTLTAGVEYLFLLDSEGTTVRTHTFKIDCLPTCTNGEATYIVVSDCANGEQFMVNVNVTSLGTAESMTISDDQGSAPLVANAAGTFVFGPYPNGTPVIFTINNDQDETCFLTSAAVTQSVCPPNCTEAQVITACDESVTAEFVAGAGAWNVSACGWSTPGTEVMYSFTPAETGAYQLTIESATGGYVDYFYKAASGTCDNTGWTCIDDLNSATTVNIGTLTAGVEYLFLLDSEGTTLRTHTFKIDCLPTCTNGTATYAVVSDCANGEQFMVNVNITGMGTATSVTVSDDQGSAVQNATAITSLTFGPYPNGTPVVFEIANDQDETCVLTSPALNQAACPPANDECTGAIALTAGGVFDDFAIETTNLGATRNAADHDPTTVTSTCDTFQFLTNGKDVWYTVVAPASGTLTIETATNSDTAMTDTALYAYTGTCGALTYKACSADIGGGNNFSKVVLTGLTPGASVTARVWGYNGSAGAFRISAYDASLSNAQFENANFKAYPNPVKDVLNLSHNQNISNVEIFNMLGQRVIANAVNATQGQIDMSNLASGAYLVKVTAENQTKTLKVIKQ